MRKTGSILVVDLECNCTEDTVDEIIEIGYCIVDTKTLTIPSGMKTILVQPENPITEYCTKLTSLKQEDFVGTHDLRSAMGQLSKVISRYQSWCSWGLFDYEKLIEECIRLQIPYQMPYTYFDLSMIYALLTETKKKAMWKVCSDYGLKVFGLHRGIYDAFNTASLLIELMKDTRLGHSIRQELFEQRKVNWDD